MSKRVFNPAEFLFNLSMTGHIHSFVWCDYDTHKFAKIYNPARIYTVEFNSGLKITSDPYIKNCSPTRSISHPALAKQSHRRLLEELCDRTISILEGGYNV